MAEIITPKRVRDEDEKKYEDIVYIKMSSVSELVELANTLGVKMVFKDGKNYLFMHEGIKYTAKQ